MSFLGKLASLFVEVKATGLDAVNKAVENLGGGLLALSAAAGKVGAEVAKTLAGAGAGGLSAHIEKAQKLLNQFGYGTLEAVFKGTTSGVVALSQAMAPVTGQIWGFVQAGIQASWAGQMFGYQFREISRQVASLFVPQIALAVDWLARLIRWFQTLSGEQQAGLRNWLLFAGGLTLAAVILPKVVAGVQLLWAAFVALRVVLAGLMLTNPLALALTAALVVLAALAAATKDWKDVMAGIADMGRAIAAPFEDMLKTIRSIVAALRELRGQKEGEGPGITSEVTGYLRRQHERSRKINEWMPLTMLTSAMGWETGTRGLSRFGALANPLSQVGGAIGGLFGWDPLKGVRDKEGRKELAPAVGGFENIEDTYRRISDKSKIVGFAGAQKTYEEQALEKLDLIYTGINAIRQRADGIRNPVV